MWHFLLPACSTRERPESVVGALDHEKLTDVILDEHRHADHQAVRRWCVRVVEVVGLRHVSCYHYKGVGVVEAAFSSEARACAYALSRSGEKYGNAGEVSQWVVDNPNSNDWVASFEDGVERHRNTRRSPTRR